jgi:hypothetical protein
MCSGVNEIGDIGEMTVVFGDGDETSQTGLSVESPSIKREVRREGTDRCVVSVCLVVGMAVVKQVLLKVRRRLPEVVDVRERLDDFTKRLASRCPRVRWDDVFDARSNVREVIYEFDA